MKLWLALLLFQSPLFAFAQSLTASQAIARIQQRFAADLGPDTVDTIKAGDPSTQITGIAVTFLDTMDVLRETVRRGDNLVITHEPTFYNHLDKVALLKNDPVYQEKLAFIEQHRLVVFRLHDGIHSVPPDHIELGLIKALGWQAYTTPNDPFFATIPQTTLADLARSVQKTLAIRTLRIVGDPTLPLTRVALLPGAAGMQDQIATLRRDDVEVLIAGEASEWETVEYVRDATAQGRHKALILLGHEPSEEPGMEQCTDDLRFLFPGLAVHHISAGQPMWNPEHPVSRPPSH